MWNRLINHGPTVLVSTHDEQGKYNIAPIAWVSPVQKSPPKLLLVVGKSHKTYSNIIATKEFVVCVPHANQAGLVIQTGTSKGAETNKFLDFHIESFKAEKLNILIPDGCVGYLECKLSNRLEQEKVDIIIGEIIAAKAVKAAFSERMLIEKPEGKTLHHLGGSLFCTPSDNIIEITE
ncbi:MAG: flavin reductase family protein [Calditrichia bacterium]|nr:flavin reductase family protein [Calditrichia bacterium]